jgi:gluconate 2-dehydrogenase gamma chain
MPSLIRRRSLLVGGAALPALAFGGCRRRVQPPPGLAGAARDRPPGHVLDASQWETLRAACARLIPTDADAGATEANVAGYIDAQLTTTQIGTFRAEILAGLRKLDELARSEGGAGFASLPPEAQDRVLARIQRGVRLEGLRQGSRHFLLVLLTLSLEGFLCDPVYGGNRDEVGWRFLRFSMRPPRPRRPYRGRG